VRNEWRRFVFVVFVGVGFRLGGVFSEGRLDVLDEGWRWGWV
jgi:hypothetical protein